MKTLLLITGTLLIVKSLFASVIMVNMPQGIVGGEKEVLTIGFSSEAPIMDVMLNSTVEFSPNVYSNIALRSVEIGSAKRDSLVTEVWDNNQYSWENKWKESYEYNADGFPTKYVVSSWNGNGWVYENKMTYQVDDNGNILAINTSLYSPEKTDWVDILRVKCLYHDNGNRQSWIMYRLSSDNSWDEYSKREFVCDKAEKEILILDFKWDVSKSRWVYLHKIEYQYNSSDVVIETATYAWMSNSNTWEYLKLQQTELDSSDNGSETVDYYWSVLDSVWVNDLKEERVYDEFDNEVQSISYVWNSYSDTWIATTRYQYSYNTVGHKTNYAKFDWIIEMNDWVGDWQNDDYRYDNNDNLLEYSVSNWTLSANNWVNNQRKLFYYSEEVITTNSLTKLDEKLKVYPNPSSDAIAFNLESNSTKAVLNLYSLNGTIVLSTLIGSDERVSIKHLVSGLYFYEVADNTGIFKGSIAIQ